MQRSDLEGAKRQRALLFCSVIRIAVANPNRGTWGRNRTWNKCEGFAQRLCRESRLRTVATGLGLGSRSIGDRVTEKQRTDRCAIGDAVAR